MSRIRDKEDPQCYNPNQDTEGDCPSCVNCSGYCEWPCKTWFVWHDTAICKDEREKVLKEVTEMFCIQKDSEAWRWIESLRQQEQLK